MEQWSEENAKLKVAAEKVEVLKKYYGKNTLNVFMIGHSHFYDQREAFNIIIEYFQECIRATRNEPSAITGWLFSASNIGKILNNETYSEATHVHYTDAA
jgi:hypothetical protein